MTLCAGDRVLRYRSDADVASVAALFLLTARSARRNSLERAQERVAGW
jgi:hypothetical protein